MLKPFLLVLVIAVINGCVATPVSVKRAVDGDTLKTGNGYLLMRIRSAENDLVFRFTSESSVIEVSCVRQDGCYTRYNNPLLIASVPAGNYRWKSYKMLESGQEFLFEGEMQARIVAGEINYIGDIYIEHFPDFVRANVNNRFFDIEDKLATDYPKITESYPLTNNTLRSVKK